MLQIGDCRIVSVLEQEFEPRVDFLFPELDLASLAGEQSWLEPSYLDFSNGVVRLAIQSFIVKVDGLTIIVDTGIGEEKPRHRPEWHGRKNTGFLDSLGEHGVAPETVDLVVCTHIHVDHVGWNTQWMDGTWQPTFPNARYLIPSIERDHMRAQAEPPSYYADSVVPLPGRMVDWVQPHHEICPGLTLVPLPGHSPGMVGLRVEREGKKAILCSDALHSPFQLRLPEVSSSLCSDAGLAWTTRHALLSECVAEDMLLVPAHLREHAAIRVHRDGHVFQPEFVDFVG
ncbi:MULTISPECIES: MBL fold metallo-hydrolase [unclassified Mesorhizobium]|uniref:MBL fold metallo-hydrolase n=1 Tax=unclassified Mesorhizobium TaxID=325217 RepID=UPI00301491DC